MFRKKGHVNDCAAVKRGAGWKALISVALALVLLIAVAPMQAKAASAGTLTIQKTVQNPGNVTDPYSSYRFQLKLYYLAPEPRVITGDPTDVQATTATIVDNSYLDIPGTITQTGVMVSTSDTMSNSTTYGAATVSTPYNQALGGLTAGTTYYYRAYVVSGGVPYYGEVKSFTTPTPLITISGEVIWDDLNNLLGLRPAVAPVNLYRNGEYFATTSVNAYENWKFSFTSLEELAPDGSRYIYTVGKATDWEPPGFWEYYKIIIDNEYYYLTYTIFSNVTAISYDEYSILSDNEKDDSSAGFSTPGSKDYAAPAVQSLGAAVPGNYRAADMPASEYARLSEWGINLQKADTGVYTFNLTKGQSIIIDGLEADTYFVVTELGAVSGGSSVSLDDSRCSATVAGAGSGEAAYPEASGFIQDGAAAQTNFIYTFPTPAKQWTVTFDGNGATTQADPAIKTVSDGEMAGALPTPPLRTGYAFGGWNTNRDGSGTSFTAFTRVTADITVYAQWRASTAVFYILSFDLNGGDGQPPATQTLRAGTLAAAVANPARSGNRFLGWNTAADASGLNWDFGVSVMPARDVTLYAQWSADEKPENPVGPVIPAGTESDPEEGGPAPPAIRIGDIEIPLVGTKGMYWALVNLILAIAGVALAVVLAVRGIFAKKEEKQQEPQAQEQESPKKDRRLLFTVLAAGTAVAGVIVFLLTENMRLPMALTDVWTIVMAVLAAGETILASITGNDGTKRERSGKRLAAVPASAE